MPNALITGGSRGFGHALATALAARGWNLVIDARDAERLDRAAGGLRRSTPSPRIAAIAGDVSDPDHREELARAVAELGRLDLLVNNASDLGPSPLPQLTDLRTGALRTLFEVNTVAPLALVQRTLPALLAAEGTVVNVTSDAATEAYPGWGGYGASKAALDHLSAVLAVEHPELTVLAFDPGDMRTDMHQAAFPGEDISDRPSPEEAVPALLHLLGSDASSGRYRGANLRTPVGALL